MQEGFLLSAEVRQRKVYFSALMILPSCHFLFIFSRQRAAISFSQKRR